MKINSLTLVNFKGISQLSVTFDGENSTIYGNNGTGKTTVYDAFLFLLFGKDSQSNTKFSIKPIKAPNGIEVSVTGVFEIDGQQVELKKVVKENWTKKRGSMEATYAGDVTSCYVDEVPYKVTEYADYIKNICDEEVFKLLTNPLHFNANIKWQERRKTLFEICGDVKDEQLFATMLLEYNQTEQDLKTALSSLQENATDENAMARLKETQEKLSTLKGYKALNEAISNRSFEEYKKILADRRKSINKELELIPTKINEAALSIVEVDLKVANEKLKELNPQQTELETKLNQLETGSDIAKLNTQLSNLKTQLQEVERSNNTYRNEQEDTQRKDRKEKEQPIQERLNEVREEHLTTKSLYQNTQSQVETQRQLVDRYRKEYMRLVEEKQELIAECPTCKQAIPQEQIETAKKAYEDNRNTELEKYKSVGTQAKIKANEFEKQATELSAKELALTTQKKLLEEQLERLEQGDLIILDRSTYARDKATLYAQIQAVEGDISNSKVNLSQEIERLKTALQSVRNDIAKHTKEILQGEQNTLSEQRISTYEMQQKEYIKQFEETEKQLYYCDLFTKKKVSLITEQVNGKFKIAKFKLFNTLVNGGIEDCCEVIVNDVPFSDLNNAMKINVGIDVINTLQQHFKFAPPVFVDNAECVTDVYRLNSQMIKLVVPPSYEALPKEVQDSCTKTDYYKEYQTLKFEKEDN